MHEWGADLLVMLRDSAAEEEVCGAGGGISLLEGVGAAFMLVAGTVVLALLLWDEVRNYENKMSDGY